MARKKPARPAKKAKKQAKKKTASKAAARRGAKKASKKAPKKAAKKAARKSAPKRSAKAAKARKPAVKARPATRPARAEAAAEPRKKPNLDRPRKTVADVHGIPSSLDMNRSPSAAKSGRAEMKDRLSKNTGPGPAITAGDVDADWESAESVGDEAPGGDNPTPDQDVVDEIGEALGVNYEEGEELKGAAKIEDRDKHRWELDPASKDDFDDQ
jgi:cell wall-associated NlpC family hydrolase